MTNEIISCEFAVPAPALLVFSSLWAGLWKLRPSFRWCWFICSVTVSSPWTRRLLMQSDRTASAGPARVRLFLVHPGLGLFLDSSLALTLQLRADWILRWVNTAECHREQQTAKLLLSKWIRRQNKSVCLSDDGLIIISQNHGWIHPHILWILKLSEKNKELKHSASVYLYMSGPNTGSESMWAMQFSSIW